jgi:hypothetical protein
MFWQPHSLARRLVQGREAARRDYRPAALKFGHSDCVILR